MAVSAHIAELERRHQALERKIEMARARPGTDALELAELKRQKLKLKDEIQKLKSNQTVH